MAYIGQAPTNAPLTSSDIQDGVIVAADLADDSVGTDEIVNDAVTADKLANSINTAIAANTAKVSFTPDAAQVFNDTGADVDFRVEASGEAHALFVQGSDGKVGIGTPASTPLGNLHVASGDSSATANANADELVIEGNTVSGLSILSATNSTGNIYFGDSVNNGIGTIIYDHSTNRMSFMTDGSTRMYITDLGGIDGACAGTSTPCLSLESTHGSYGGEILQLNAYRGGTQDAYSFIQCWSNTDGTSEAEFKVRNTGASYNDAGVWNTGADYAEFFEWKDGNPSDEDRAGMTVVLDGDKIRKANEGETPIGVVSANPAVVGDSAWNRWNQKYLKDDFGRKILEEYTNSQGDLDKKAKLNPDFDDKLEYVPREDRQEWDAIGLLGKLRILKDQPVADSWIKMKDVSETVEMWFVK